MAGRDHTLYMAIGHKDGKFDKKYHAQVTGWFGTHGTLF